MKRRGRSHHAAVPERFAGSSPRGKGAAQHYGNRPSMATFAQPDLIRQLWRKLHGQRDCDDAVFARRLRKYHKVSSMRLLTRHPV